MHPALDGDVRVCDTRRQQLAQCTKHKDIPRRNFPPFLEHVFQLLEDRVLQDGIDDEDEGGEDACEERLRALGAEEVVEGGEGGSGLFWCGKGGGVGEGSFLVRRGFLLASCHPCIYDPDGVREEHGCAAG